MNNAAKTEATETLELLADRAAEDGEHSVVAACQLLLGWRENVTPAERRSAQRQVSAYRAAISG